MSISNVFRNLSWSGLSRTSRLVILITPFWFIWGSAIGWLVWVTYESIPESRWWLPPAVIVITPYLLSAVVMLRRPLWSLLRLAANVFLWAASPFPLTLENFGGWETEETVRRAVALVSFVAAFFTEGWQWYLTLATFLTLGWGWPVTRYLTWTRLSEETRTDIADLITTFRHLLLYPLRWHFFLLEWWEELLLGVQWKVEWVEPRRGYETTDPPAHWEAQDWRLSPRAFFRHWIGIGTLVAVVFLGWWATPIVLVALVARKFFVSPWNPIDPVAWKNIDLMDTPVILRSARLYALVSGDKRLRWQVGNLPGVLGILGFLKGPDVTMRLGWKYHNPDRRPHIHDRKVDCYDKIHAQREGIMRLGPGWMEGAGDAQMKSWGNAPSLTEGLSFPAPPWQCRHWLLVIPAVIWWLIRFIFALIWQGMRLVLNVYFWWQEVLVVKIIDPAAGADYQEAYAAIICQGVFWKGEVETHKYFGRWGPAVVKEKILCGYQAVNRAWKDLIKASVIRDLEDTDFNRWQFAKRVGEDVGIGPASRLYDARY